MAGVMAWVVAFTATAQAQYTPPNSVIGTSGQITITSSSGNIQIALADSGVTAATYNFGNGSVVVDSKGRITTVTAPTNLQTTGGTLALGGFGSITGTLAVANGGTGATSYTNGQLLIGNTTGNTLAKATLTAGTGITVGNGSGAITLSLDQSISPTWSGSHTFTNSVTHNGTHNTAPNQVGVTPNASDIMNRSQMDSRVWNILEPCVCEATLGSASSVTAAAGYVGISSSSVNGHSDASTLSSLAWAKWVFGPTGGWVYWNQPWAFNFKMVGNGGLAGYTHSSDDFRITTASGAWPYTPSSSDYSVGFKYISGAWTVFMTNGSTITYATSVTDAPGSYTLNILVYCNGTTVTFYRRRMQCADSWLNIGSVNIPVSGGVTCGVGVGATNDGVTAQAAYFSVAGDLKFIDLSGYTTN
jgi:hypothetical protein